MNRSENPLANTGTRKHGPERVEPGGSPSTTDTMRVDAEVNDAAAPPEGDAMVSDVRGSRERGAAPTGASRSSAQTRESARADSSGEPWRLRPRGLDSREVRDRWVAAQGEFVDDPSQAVRDADALASRVAEAVVAEIEARRTELRSAWDGGSGTDTESLRVALRDYRSFVEHLAGERV